MLKITNPLTTALTTILVLVLVIVFGSLLGYIQLEQTHSDYNGDYLILRFQTNNKVPYQAFVCQHSSKYFLINCHFSKVLENATELKGGK